MITDPRHLAKPTKAQAEWHDYELGMFVHWFPISYEELDMDRLQDPDYQRMKSGKVHCAEFDPEQWVQSAVDLGAKYIVFVAKHGMGFCLWQTEYGEFSLNNAPYRGDPVGALYTACAARGLKMGVYLAGISYNYGAEDLGVLPDPERQRQYNTLYRNWLTELLSRYGEMTEVWFDGSLCIEVGDILKKYAPNAMVFQSKYATIRWVGQEEGYASDPAYNSLSRYDALSGVSTQRHGDPDGDAWMPLECDARLRNDWGWSDDLERNRLRSVDELMSMYYRSVGHGAVMLINQAPNPGGRIIDEDMARMKAFGDEIRRRFSTPIAETRGEGDVVELPLGGVKKVDHVIIMEDIWHGERMRIYVVEGYDGAQWKRLSAGTAVGHKKIDYFEEAEVSAVRVRALDSIGTPIIRAFAAYYVGETPVITEQPARGLYKLGDWGTEMYDLETYSAHFHYPIDAFIDDAGQYRVTVKVARDATPFIVERAWIEINGVAHEEYVSRADGENVFDIYIGGSGSKVEFHMTSRYDRTPHLAGEAYIQRIM